MFARRKSIVLVTGASIALAVAVLGREPLARLFLADAAGRSQGTSKTTREEVAKAVPTPQEIATPHLTDAEQECERVIEEHIGALNTFFAEAKKNTRPFAEQALGWSSKWRLVADYVPFTSKVRHQTFIREKFEEYIFSPPQLEAAVKQTVDSYLNHIESIEGEMLVKIRTDVSDFPSTYMIAQLDEVTLRAAYDEAIERAIAASGSDLRANIGTEIVSQITGQVLAQVAIRLGVSAGILATGAGSGWWTFGIGVVVGVIVDQIVSWVWDWYADPTGDLATELDAKLDEINRLIIDGSTDVQGLRQRLREFARGRAVVRRQAVLAILEPQ